MSRILPILFNAEMVRAILDGRKTVTRRMVKGLPEGTYRIEQVGGHDWEALYGMRNCGALLEMYKTVKPPYQPGDILYVRETWCKGSLDYHEERYFYKADDNDFYCQWHPSIHMPKEAARIWLRCINVRVERLQEIDDAGVVAEGLQIGDPFDELWNSTLKKSDIDRYGWGANPWVWVIEFERREKPD